MSTIDPIRSAPITPGGAPASPTSSEVDLLPEGVSSGGMQALTESLYLLVGKLAHAREALAKTQSTAKYHERNNAIDAAKEARRKAEEAAKEGGFLDALVEYSGLVEVMSAMPGVSEGDAKDLAKDVLKGALIAGSLVATVLSAGTTAALAVAVIGVALSYGGQAVASSGVFGDEASKYIGIGMQIAGAGCMVAAGFIGDTSALTQTASVINGGIAIVNGTDQIVTSVNQYKADQHNIDATKLEQTIKRLEKMIDDLLEQLKEDKKVVDKTTSLAHETIQSIDRAQLASVQHLRA